MYVNFSIPCIKYKYIFFTKLLFDTILIRVQYHFKISICNTDVFGAPEVEHLRFFTHIEHEHQQCYVIESVKLHSVACQLLPVAFLRVSIILPKNMTD